MSRLSRISDWTLTSSALLLHLESEVLLVFVLLCILFGRCSWLVASWGVGGSLLLVGVSVVQHRVAVVCRVEFVHGAVVAHTHAAIVQDLATVSGVVVFQVSGSGWWGVEAHSGGTCGHALHEIWVEDIASHRGTKGFHDRGFPCKVASIACLNFILCHLHTDRVAISQWRLVSVLLELFPQLVNPLWGDVRH